MELISTRSNSKKVSFRTALLDCIPQDGGLYVPLKEEDLRPWVMYMSENTGFSSIAGTLTSALLKEDFSPVVSERIAASAFAAWSPELRQLDERLFQLELHHGPTGCHKDFGLSWLSSALEHICTMEDRTATVLAATSGVSGRSMATAFAGKKRLKLVLLYAKGTVMGLEPSMLAENGGNVFPLEINGDITRARTLVREIYSDEALVSRHGLTLANTLNIGRLLPHVFFYMYAFTRLRKKVGGDIFYAVPSGTYGNLVAGLYAWKFSLPVNGFITDATESVACDVHGRCFCSDTDIPLDKRGPTDPASPSNLERLEQVFAVNPAMLRGLVFPAPVEQSAVPSYIKSAWDRYGVLLDSETARAYGALLKVEDRVNSDEGTVVLVSKDHPAFDSAAIKRACGCEPERPEWFDATFTPVSGVRCIEPHKTVLEAFLTTI